MTKGTSRRLDLVMLLARLMLGPRHLSAQGRGRARVRRSHLQLAGVTAEFLADAGPDRVAQRHVMGRAKQAGLS